MVSSADKTAAHASHADIKPPLRQSPPILVEPDDGTVQWPDTGKIVLEQEFQEIVAKQRQEREGRHIKFNPDLRAYFGWCRRHHNLYCLEGGKVLKRTKKVDDMIRKGNCGTKLLALAAQPVGTEIKYRKLSRNQEQPQGWGESTLLCDWALKLLPIIPLITLSIGVLYYSSAHNWFRPTLWFPNPFAQENRELADKANLYFALTFLFAAFGGMLWALIYHWRKVTSTAWNATPLYGSHLYALYDDDLTPLDPRNDPLGFGLYSGPLGDFLDRNPYGDAKAADRGSVHTAMDRKNNRGDDKYVRS